MMSSHGESSEITGSPPPIECFFRVLPSPLHLIGWSERHVTSSHHGTSNNWGDLWLAAPQGFRDDPELANWRERFPTRFNRGPVGPLDSTLGARAAFLAYVSAHGASQNFPEYVRVGIGEYHGLSAFRSAKKAVEYAAASPPGTLIGTIWGTVLGALPDDDLIINPDAVRVAVCYWVEPPLAVEEFKQLHALSPRD